MNKICETLLVKFLNYIIGNMTQLHIALVKQYLRWCVCLQVSCTNIEHDYGTCIFRCYNSVLLKTITRCKSSFLTLACIIATTRSYVLDFAWVSGFFIMKAFVLVALLVVFAAVVVANEVEEDEIEFHPHSKVSL